MSSTLTIVDDPWVAPVLPKVALAILAKTKLDVPTDEQWKAYVERFPTAVDYGYEQDKVLFGVADDGAWVLVVGEEFWLIRPPGVEGQDHLYILEAFGVIA